MLCQKIKKILFEGIIFKNWRVKIKKIIQLFKIIIINDGKNKIQMFKETEFVETNEYSCFIN